MRDGYGLIGLINKSFGPIRILNGEKQILGQKPLFLGQNGPNLAQNPNFGKKFLQYIDFLAQISHFAQSELQKKKKLLYGHFRHF